VKPDKVPDCPAAIQKVARTLGIMVQSLTGWYFTEQEWE